MRRALRWLLGIEPLGTVPLRFYPYSRLLKLPCVYLFRHRIYYYQFHPWAIRKESAL